jgi:hypothetical protein
MAVLPICPPCSLKRGVIKTSRIAPFNTAKISSKSQIARALENIEIPVCLSDQVFNRVPVASEYSTGDE